MTKASRERSRGKNSREMALKLQEKMGLDNVQGVRKVGIASILLLFGMMAMFLVPMQADRSYAEAPDRSSFGADVATKMAAKVYSTISVALDSEVSVEIIPKSTGAFSMSSANLQVATNNTSGYGVYLGTIDGTQELKAADLENKATIGAVGGVMTAKDFEKNLNTWGYALTREAATVETEYRAIPGNGGEIVYTSDATSAGDEFYLNFGTAVDTKLPAGNYQNSVVVSVVANPVEISGFAQIYYMQEMTPGVCESAQVHERGQLVDVRDNKIYWVTKMKDGNCWMSQNLALNLTAGETLTSKYTDVTTDWVVPATTEGQVPPAYNDAEVNWLHRSWDLGDYVLATPEKAEFCTAEGGTNMGTSVLPGQTIGANCSDVQATLGWKMGYEATVGTWKGEPAGLEGAAGIVAADAQSQTYDAHYSLGNYYQFGAATAGSVSKDAVSKLEGGVAKYNDENSVSSICPKGWVLPKAGTNLIDSYPAERDKSWYGLLKTYGYGVDEVEYTNHQEGKFAEVHNQDLVKTPFYFTRSGNLSLADGQLRNVGVRVRYWSSTGTAVNTMAFSADLDGNTIGPSAQASRGSGFAIRCVAR